MSRTLLQTGDALMSWWCLVRSLAQTRVNTSGRVSKGSVSPPSPQHTCAVAWNLLFWLAGKSKSCWTAIASNTTHHHHQLFSKWNRPRRQAKCLGRYFSTGHASKINTGKSPSPSTFPDYFSFESLVNPRYTHNSTRLMKTHFNIVPHFFFPRD